MEQFAKAAVIESCFKAVAEVTCVAFGLCLVSSALVQSVKKSVWRRSCMVSVHKALALAGAQQSDLAAIFQALEDDRAGHRMEEDACGPFAELNPAILGQPPYGLNLKRCNIVKKAVKHAPDWSVKFTCVIISSVDVSISMLVAWVDMRTCANGL